MHRVTRLMAVKLALPEHAAELAGPLVDAAEAYRLPWTVLAGICDRESRYGLALERGLGDGGHGHGLMQLDDRRWGEWLRTHDWRDPAVNIRQGAAILAMCRDYLREPPGDKLRLTAAQAKRRGVRAGTYPDPRPLRDPALLRAAIAAYNTGERNVLLSIAAGVNPDITTTGRDYAADVLRRAAALEAAFTAALAA